MRKRLGEMLVEARLVSEFQVSVAAGRAKNFQSKIGKELVSLGFVTEEDLACTLQQQLKMKWVSLKDIEILPEVIEEVKQDIAEKFFVMPIAAEKKSFTIATNEPTDISALDTLRFILGRSIIPVIATSSDIRWAIDKYYKGITEPAEVVPTVPLRKNEPKFGSDYKLNIEQIQCLLETLVDVLSEKGIVNKEELYKCLDKKQ